MVPWPPMGGGTGGHGAESGTFSFVDSPQCPIAVGNFQDFHTFPACFPPVSLPPLRLSYSVPVSECSLPIAAATTKLLLITTCCRLLRGLTSSFIGCRAAVLADVHPPSDAATCHWRTCKAATAH